MMTFARTILVLLFLLLSFSSGPLANPYDIFEITDPLKKPLLARQIAEPEPRLTIEHDGTYLLNLGMSISMFQYRTSPDHAVQLGLFGTVSPSLMFRAEQFQFDAIDSRYGVFVDGQYGLVVARAGVGHYCSHASVQRVETERLTTPAFDDYFGREFWNAHLEADFFDTRLYCGIIGQAELWGTSKAENKDIRWSTGIEKTLRAPFYSRLAVIGGIGLSFFRSRHFETITEAMAGVEINDIRAFISYYNGFEQRGNFENRRKEQAAVGVGFRF